MKICTCQYCGVVFDYDKCVELYGEGGTYYGNITKCPLCKSAVFETEQSMTQRPFDNEMKSTRREDEGT